MYQLNTFSNNPKLTTIKYVIFVRCPTQILKNILVTCLAQQLLKKMVLHCHLLVHSDMALLNKTVETGHVYFTVAHIKMFNDKIRSQDVLSVKM